MLADMYGPVPHVNRGPPPLDAQSADWMRDKSSRFGQHTSTVYNSLFNKEMLTMNWIYFLVKVLASAGTVWLLVVLFMASSSVVFSDTTDSAVYVTNSFYTTNDNDQNVSWQVLTGFPWNQYPRPLGGASYGTTLQFEHFYECMYIAQEGYGLCNSSAVTASVASYKTCLDANYAIPLGSCNTFATANYWPSANQYSACVNEKLGAGSVATLNAFRSCIDMNLWPLYETPQDVTSTFFLGSYSWPLLTVTSLFLLTVFGLYTWYPVDWEETELIEKGKPGSSFTRLGMLWSGLASLLAIFWLVCVMLIAFRRVGNNGGSWPNTYATTYPSTQQTNVVMVVTTLAVVFYFLFDLSEFRDRDRKEYHKLRPSNGQEDRDKGLKEESRIRMSTRIPVPVSMAGTNQVGYYFPNEHTNYNSGGDIYSTAYFSPVLLKTWADAYLLDPLFFVGVMGATLQVFTADVYNVFWCLMFYRLAHVGISRVVHFAYIHPDSTEGKNGKEALAATKVLGLALHFAGICALVVPFYIIADTTRMLMEYSVLTITFYLLYAVPEGLRLLGHLWLTVRSTQESAKTNALYILIVSQFIWAWDLIVRSIILWFLVLPYISSGTRGTKSYLLAGNQAIAVVLAL